MSLLFIDKGDCVRRSLFFWLCSRSFFSFSCDKPPWMLYLFVFVVEQSKSKVVSGWLPIPQSPHLHQPLDQCLSFFLLPPSIVSFDLVIFTIALLFGIVSTIWYANKSLPSGCHERDCWWVHLGRHQILGTRWFLKGTIIVQYNPSSLQRF